MENNNRYSRIVIFGKSGSGKSTFAYKLHKTTQLPVHYLDRYFFTTNWVERDYQQFLALYQSLVRQERWIIDGNVIKSLEMRYQRAELCIYFNYPRWRCLGGIIKRYFFKDRQIKDRAEGCSETIRWKLISYIWTFNKRTNAQIEQLKKSYPSVTFIEIKNSNDLKKLEKQLRINL